ncbi:acyltransferase family protein [Methylobacterium sp. P31]
MQRVLCLDGWRGAAILMVLFGHFLGTRGINLGRFGVEFFFVLSGRLMAEILFVKSEALPSFYWRRFSRIYPALLCFVLSAMAIAVVRDHGARLQGYLAALTLTYNYYQLWFGQVGVVDHVWSLCVEEHTYLVLGLIALIWRKSRFNVALLIGLLAVIGCMNGLVCTWIGKSYTEVYWRSDVRGASILFGASAYLVLQGRREWLILAARLSLPLVMFGMFLNLKIVPDPVKYSLGTGCVALAVAAIGDLRNNLSGLLKASPLVGLGVCSYSIYLWQQPFYVLRDKLSSWTGSVFVIPAILMGMASFFVIERPARTYLNGCLHGYRNRRATMAS